MTPASVPLVLAVVGHRDPIPTELPRLRHDLRHDLQALMAALPHTPLLMLNGLASGMDSEAAEVFLELCGRRPDGPRHQLVAALPKLPASYRQDFNPGAERERLERLLGACTAVLHPGNCPGLRGVAPAGQELPSPECYGQQGVFLVRHAFLVLAFNNGVETMEVGGTAQTVAMQKGEVHPLFLTVEEVIAALEPGALIEYNTPRFKNQLPAGISQPRRSYWLQARPCRELTDLLAIPSRIERFNQAFPTPASGRRAWVVRRCLAEALEVQELWAAMGVPFDAADLLQSRMHPDLHWVRTLLRARRLQLLCQPLGAAAPTPQAWEVAHQWLLAQRDDLDRTCERQSRRHRRLRQGLVVLGVAALAASLLGWGWITLGCLAVAMALLGSQGQGRDRAERRRDQLRRCLRAYEQALFTAADAPLRQHRLRCALEAVGRDTLGELNDWVSAQL